MSEKVKSKEISRRRTFALLGLAVASIPAMALAIREADAQTGGMERRDDRRTDAASSVLFLNPHCLINHKSRRLVGDTVQLRRRQVVCAAIVDAISMTSLKAGTA